jgi:tRNA(Ile)-lysidine synthase
MTIVVAVSGGADSVGLLRLLHEVNCREGAGTSIVVAHYNHQLRGAASEADEVFVRQLAADLGVSVVVERGAAARNEGEGRTASSGSEEQWRDQRYQFFLRVAHQHGGRYIAQAHHADDRIESILHHQFRGTGLTGLTSIPPFRGLGDQVVVARPLLKTNRQLIRAYLADLSQDFREDESNRSSNFTRNRIRNELIPLLKDMGYTNYDHSLIRLAEQAREVQDWLEEVAASIVVKAVSQERSNIFIDVGLVGCVPWPVQRELLVQVWKKMEWPLGEMTANQWHRLRVLLENQPVDVGSFQLPGAIDVQREGSRLQLVRLPQG